MQDMVVSELQNDTLNDALFSKGAELLARQMQRISDKLEALDINGIAAMMARGFLDRLDRNNENSMKANINNTIGVDLPGQIRAEGLEQALAVKMAENVALIKSVKDEYKEKVGKLLRDNVMDGQRPSNIVTQIKEVGNVSKSRARFIARDQTAKANSDITQLRAEALGAKMYVWSSSNDERSRPDHDVLDGMYCKYGDSSVFSDDQGKTWKKRSTIGAVEDVAGHPINCRCVQLPVISWG